MFTHVCICTLPLCDHSTLPILVLSRCDTWENNSISKYAFILFWFIPKCYPNTSFVRIHFRVIWWWCMHHMWSIFPIWWENDEFVHFLFVTAPYRLFYTVEDICLYSTQEKISLITIYLNMFFHLLFYFGLCQGVTLEI